MGAEIRADTDAFGQEQREINTRQFEELRQQIDLENRQTRETVEAIDRRQQAQDENFRAEQHAQDARNQSIQERLGDVGDLVEQETASTREAVIRAQRESEERLTGALRDLNLPTSYDSVLLEQAQFEEQARASGFGATGQQAVSPFGRRESFSLPHDLEPPPREDLRASVDAPAPTQPEGIGGVIGGGGELELPSIVVDEPRDIEASLVRPEPGAPGETPGPRAAEFVEPTQEAEPVSQARVQSALERTPSEAEAARASVGRTASLTPSEEAASDQFFLQEVYSGSDAEPSPEQRLSLSPAEQSVRYPEPPASPEASQERLRLVDTQDFLSGFDRPASPQPEPEPEPEPASEPAPSREQRLVALQDAQREDELYLQQLQSEADFERRKRAGRAMVDAAYPRSVGLEPEPASSESEDD